MTFYLNCEQHYQFRIRILATVAALSVSSFAASQDEDETPFYLTLDPPPATVKTPQDELNTFRLPDGFRAELVAAEPLVEDPVSITWDEDGKLYAVEMRGYMQDSYGTDEDEPIGAVIRLHDDDGDGLMDRRETLLDELVLPRAIAIVPEGLLLAEPPNLWLCPGEINKASTIDCEKRFSLTEYGNQPGSVEHQENALVLGMDNWIYNAKSFRKFRLRGDDFEIRRTVFRGQWGMGQDDDGFMYYNGNSNFITGDLYADADVMRANVSPAPGLSRRLYRGDEVHTIRVNPGVNRAYLDNVLRPDGRLRGPTGASGIEIYRGDQLSQKFYGSGFVPESAANIVIQVELEKGDLEVNVNHITYPDEQWGQRDFMASTDERFRPVETKTGPDGALYVVDMYRGIIQDYIFMSDQLREQVLRRGLDRPIGMGRIWRIVEDESSISYESPQLSSATEQELIDNLSHPNGWRRDTAQRMLVGAVSSTIDDLLFRTLNSENEQQAIHALWALEGRESLTEEHVSQFLDSGNNRFANHAMRAGCDLLNSDDVLNRLLEQSGAVKSFQQNLIFCLGRNLNEEGFSYLIENLDDLIGQPFQRVALQTAISGKEIDVLKRTQDRIASQFPNEGSDDLQLVEFLQAITKQAVLEEDVDGSKLAGLLDFIVQFDGPSWYQERLLVGIYEATHMANFERIELPRAHNIFDAGSTLLSASLSSAVSDARRAFTWQGDTLAGNQKPLTAAEEARMIRGAGLFASHCSSCHGIDGQGAEGLAPSLRQSNRITKAPEHLIRIVLDGLAGPIEVDGNEWNSVMPGMSHIAEFDDEGISGLVTYLRRSWGHNGGPIHPEAVATIREETQDRNLQWTDEDLQDVEINRHYQQFVGRYGGVRFDYNGKELVVTASIYDGPLVEVGEDIFLFEARGNRFEFDRSETGSSPSIWVGSDSSKRRVMRTGD